MAKMMNQNVLIEFLSQELVSDIEIHRIRPSKGKPALKLDKSVWAVKAILNNGNGIFLASSRGGIREWASLDRLNEWLAGIGIHHFHVIQKEHKKR